MKIREMIRNSLRGCQAGGEAKKGHQARRPGRLPGKPNQGEENTDSPAVEKFYRDNGLCRVVGFISFQGVVKKAGVQYPARYV
jgi:hypothetical protein